MPYSSTHVPSLPQFRSEVETLFYRQQTNMHIVLHHIGRGSHDLIRSRSAVEQNFSFDLTSGFSSCQDIQQRTFTSTRSTLQMNILCFPLSSTIRTYHESDHLTRRSATSDTLQ